VLLLTQGNTNAAAAFRFMGQARWSSGLRHVSLRLCSPSSPQVITLFKSYFNSFDEDSLRNNFVLIYELLDGARAQRGHTRAQAAASDALPRAEVMDNGYPQILTPEALKLYITQQGVRSELAPFEIRVRLAYIMPFCALVPAVPER
jgi:hypothetical protein